MNKKGMGYILCCLIVITLFIFYIMFVGFMSYKSGLKQCEKYDSYGYFIELEGDYLGWCKGENICLIEMEDGTKIGLKDYLRENDLLKLKKPRVLSNQSPPVRTSDKKSDSATQKDSISVKEENQK